MAGSKRTEGEDVFFPRVATSWGAKANPPRDAIGTCEATQGWKGNHGLGRALGCGKVNFRGQVLPTAKLLRYEIDIKRLREGNTVLGIADCKVLVDGVQIYSAEDVKCGLFTSLDDFG